MARADFYILSTEDPAERNLFAARLAEKAWRQKNSVALLTEKPAHAATMDALLWSFRPDAFLPHAVAPARAPVVITEALDSGAQFDLIINLSRKVPVCDARHRLAEIVIQDALILAETRARFTQYRLAGFEMQTHKLSRE